MSNTDPWVTPLEYMKGNRKFPPPTTPEQELLYINACVDTFRQRMANDADPRIRLLFLIRVNEAKAREQDIRTYINHRSK